MNDSIFIIKAGEIRKELMDHQFAELYHLPEFMEAVAPGEAWFAKVISENLPTAYFPFTGQKWLWKWRIFQASFCQRFRPLIESGVVAPEQWQLWTSWLERKCWFCNWSYFPFNAIASAKSSRNQYFSLQPEPDEILANWKTNRKQGLKKSEGCHLISLQQTDFLLELKNLIPRLKKEAWKPTEKEIQILKRIGRIQIPDFRSLQFGIFYQGQCICLISLAKWKNKFHYLFSLSSTEGLKMEATTFFFHQFIQKEGGQDMIFDLEGSNLPGVGEYFRSLGAEEEKYGLFQL